jgi:predicted glycogen debranching enzyme
MIRLAYGRTDPWDLEHEWLDTDGRGGYASATPSGCHTRRYHGLLMANLAIPEGRHLLLAKFEDSLHDGIQEHIFTAHRYPGCLFPPHPPPLREFRLDPHPCFVYEAGAVTVEKSLLRVRGGGALLIRYDLRGTAGGLRLRLKPFAAYRGYHALMRKNPSLDDRVEPVAGGFRIAPYAGMPPLSVLTEPAPQFVASPLWYERFEYDEERERGFDWQEDLFLPGILEIPCRPGQTVWVSVSYGPPVDAPAARWDREIQARRRQRSADENLAASLFAAGEDRELLAALLAAGRQFLIRTPAGRPAVIAGYPWFGSWGRDTLIALPGLAFRSGRIGEGVEILAEIGRHECEGILPNFFSGDGTPEAYNSVDSSLLYFWAVQELLRATGDLDLVRDRFWPVMKRILHRFIGGTRFGIKMDDRGLLAAGDGQTALTWMDATVDGIPVTPRHGLAVEINALWYNAICLADELAGRFDDPDRPPEGLAACVARSFGETFWSPETGCLGDVSRNGALDTAVRPNQIFAVSLPHSPLTAERQRAVVAAVREQLLTPCGLRTLSPGHPDYRGHYRGSGAERDGAYHQGTVWPWLLGPFGEAALRVASDLPAERALLYTHLRRFLTGHLGTAGLGSVSEVFDGDAPHRPGGCIAQAWSVAELIRLYALLK